MFARGVLPLNPAPLPEPRQSLGSPVLSTHARHRAKSIIYLALRSAGGGYPHHQGTEHGLRTTFLSYLGHTNVTDAGGRSVLQRNFSFRGATSSIAASKSCASLKGRETRYKSARRA